MAIDKDLLGTKVDHRKWQYPYHDTDYLFGECPQCGEVGEVFDQNVIDNVIDERTFTCPECGIEFAYQTNWNYRFSHVEKGE